MSEPIIIITSNNEKELPDAFLRRCLFHYIRFPDKETMREIVEVHYPNLQEKLVSKSLQLFYELRSINHLKKKPSTSELMDWIKLLLMEKLGEKELSSVDWKNELPPFLQSLIKNEQDLEVLNQLKTRVTRF